MNKLDIVNEARTWLGTPFKHQGRVKNHGVDCIGVVICVLSDLGMKSRLNHKDYLNYSRFPNNKELLAEASRHLTLKKEKPSREDLSPGDIVLIAWRNNPQHAAIIMPHRHGLGILHSYAAVGKCVEHYLSDDWLSRIHYVYEV